MVLLNQSLDIPHLKMLEQFDTTSSEKLAQDSHNSQTYVKKDALESA